MPLYNPPGGGGGGETWALQASTVSLTKNKGHIANNASRLDFPLPAVATPGDFFLVSGVGAGGWRITQAAGQKIYMGANTTTAGTGGSLASNSLHDSVKLICVVANLEFNVVDNVGSLVIV